MDKKRILTVVDRLDAYLQELRDYLPASLKEYKANGGRKRSCERTLQLLIEVCIDTCQSIVKEFKLGLPDDEENLFDKMYEKRAISQEMMIRLREMKKFRNVLIHHYTNINDALVYAHAKENQKDFMEFKKEVISFLKSQK